LGCSASPLKLLAKDFVKLFFHIPTEKEKSKQKKRELGNSPDYQGASN
jgi:hypothetical protein